MVPIVALLLAVALDATAKPPPAPAITLCGQAQAPVLTARFGVLVEVLDPVEAGAPADAGTRFANVRVHFALDATTLDPDRQGEDGGLEPTLGGFEPLRPDGRYWLPWDVPPGTKLDDASLDEGWDAWLGNDNAAIGDNALEFVGVARDRVEVKWTGRTGDCEFVLEGEVPIGEVRVSAPPRADVAAALARVFGGDAMARTNVATERLEDEWTKTARLVAIVTPR